MKEWPLRNWLHLVKMLLESDPTVQLVATSASNPRELDRLRRLGGCGARCPPHQSGRIEHRAIGRRLATLPDAHWRGFRRPPFGDGARHSHFHHVPKISRLEGMASARRAAQASGRRLPVVSTKAETTAWLGKGKAVCLESISAEQVIEATRSMRPISVKHLNL